MSTTLVTATEARALFAPWRKTSALVVAVSGGPDSIALLFLLARWRRALKDGPYLVAVTVDHGLRPEGAKEARDVKRLATALGIPHVTKRWTGAKPKTGLPAAARAARYDLLAQVAHTSKTPYIVTAHTQDDQAETVLMRLLRGSGLVGLKAMSQENVRGEMTIVRPLLMIPKARLIATLTSAKIVFADDPSNRDEAFTRPRLRALMPKLASEGLTAESLSRLARRMQRADDALDQMVETAAKAVTLPDAKGFDAVLFEALPAEIRLRLLLKAIVATGSDGHPDLGQIEALLAAIAAAPPAAANGVRLRKTLAGALVTLTTTRLIVTPAPPRQTARNSPPP